ncbi:sulfite exporter TauE/SafE family protein [Chitinophaga sp. GCM10012297]|uniref:Probable membrane transporter protein n=1 Tax=Chitinophaga chungangae TaxID=2821488 RepID=A0ABS3Y968_9BACT|nr:sulfite exporter TauE/SafE family protein [Chitinophaga chungangae]MBO9151227.1 sulfite exporter TauE/SafE family protein [Chitinophaga chungangae]
MIVELCVIFFLIALIYSSAGFGGGSSYLALLALYGVGFQLVKSTALICNVAVVAGGVWQFHASGQLPWKKALQLTGLSIPMAFIGSYMPLRQEIFFLLLGIALVSAALLMALKLLKERQYTPETRKGWRFAAVGGGIGFLSGITGIGGGIYLAPVLRLGKYDTPKHIAGLCSFFILVNSLAGLLGQWAKSAVVFRAEITLPLLAAVIAGGQIGSRLSAAVLKPRWVEVATAVLILYAGIRLLLK